MKKLLILSLFLFSCTQRQKNDSKCKDYLLKVNDDKTSCEEGHNLGFTDPNNIKFDYILCVCDRWN